MADHMSARDAWEVVRAYANLELPVPTQIRYARACAIVEARIALDPSALVAALEKEREGHSPLSGEWRGLVKAIKIVKEHIK